MTIIDIYGRRYIVEVFKEAIVSLSCSRSDKFEVISSGLREDIFFFTPKPVRVRRMAIKNANCPARDEPAKRGLAKKHTMEDFNEEGGEELADYYGFTHLD